jgi:hypothetical protein
VREAFFMLLDAVELTKLPQKEFDVLEVFFLEAIEKLEVWENLQTKQRRELHFEITSQLLLHRNMMEGFEYIKRKLDRMLKLFC